MVPNLSISELIQSSWEIVKKNVWIFAGTMLGFMVIMGVCMTPMYGTIFAAANYHGGDYSPEAMGAGFGLLFMVSYLLVFLVSIFFTLGYYKMCLQAVDGQQPALSAFSVSFKKIINYILAAIVVGIVVGIGLVLCIIPGIYLALRLCLYAFYIIDTDCGPIEALTKSWEKTKGVEISLFLLFLVLYLLNIVGLLLCGIGMLITAPITYVTMAQVYRLLTKAQSPEETVIVNE